MLTSYLLRITAATAFIILCTLLPFLPGPYDSLAVSLSMMAQIFGKVGLLLVPIGAVWVASPLIFRAWLGEPMRPTQAILPLVLIHTVVGGSSAVGRSILLGMGKVRAFAVSVLIAGVGNVLLSYIFVRHLNLGLDGIVYGTIIAVSLRAGIWMPWYVLKSLRQG